MEYFRLVSCGEPPSPHCFLLILWAAHLNQGGHGYTSFAELSRPSSVELKYLCEQYIYINLYTIEWLPCMARHLLQNYSLQWAMAILKINSELTRFFCSFSLNQFNCSNLIALTEPIKFFLQNRLGFSELNQFFG